jgi:hypothetical protein
MKTYEAPEQHDWTDIKAKGRWLVVEQVGVIAKTRTGIHVPDNARMAVWVIRSAGDEVTMVAAGDRVIFLGVQSHNIDGRLFALLKEEDVVASLPMPVESDEPDESIPEVLPLPERPAANGKPRIIVPS